MCFPYLKNGTEKVSICGISPHITRFFLASCTTVSHNIVPFKRQMLTCLWLSSKSLETTVLFGFTVACHHVKLFSNKNYLCRRISKTWVLFAVNEIQTCCLKVFKKSFNACRANFGKRNMLLSFTFIWGRSKFLKKLHSFRYSSSSAIP